MLTYHCHLLLNSLLILGITAGALGFSIVAALSCDFIGVENVVVGEAFADAPYLKTIGLFYFSSATSDVDSCEQYEGQFFHSDFNKWFTSAQIASLLAPFFGLIGWVLVSFVVCSTEESCRHHDDSRSHCQIFSS